MHINDGKKHFILSKYYIFSVILTSHFKWVTHQNDSSGYLWVLRLRVVFSFGFAFLGYSYFICAIKKSAHLESLGTSSLVSEQDPGQAVTFLRAQPGARWTTLNHLGELLPAPLNQELVGCCLDKRDELEAGKPVSKLVLTGAITIQVVIYKNSLVKPGVTTLSKGKMK